MTASRRRIPSVTVALLAVLAACSEDGESGGGRPAPVTTAAAEPATETTTAAPSTTAELPNVDDPPPDWCDAARDVEGASDAVDAVDFADPDALQDAIGELVERTGFALDLAPDEIAADVRITYDGMVAFRDALAAVDYDFLEVDLTVLADPDGTLETAGDRIGQYNSEVCGIPLDADDGDDGDGGGFDPEAGTLREQIIDSLVATGLTVEQAECLYERIDFADPEQTSDDAVITAALAACGVDEEGLGS